METTTETTTIKLPSFLAIYPFIASKIINGKLKCDFCPNYFPVINSFYVIALPDTNQVCCHPCSYLRTGHNPHAKNIEEAKQKQILIQQQKEARIKEKEEKEAAKKLKQQKKEANHNHPKLF